MLDKNLNKAFNAYSLLPVILLLTMLPHLYTVSLVIFLFILFAQMWFFLHSLDFIALPNKWVLFLLVMLSIIILLINSGFSFSQKTALSLLCIMLSLKLLEIKNELDRRNIFLVIYLGYFVLITHFLYSQDILSGLFSLINIFILTALLIAFNRKPQSSFSASETMHLLAQLFLKALPVAIILFLFFPRIPGPLWSLPETGQTATSGLSDSMYPGSVSELVDSDEIAFRVKFNQSPPTADKLYWRGPVLTKTDGFLWTQSISRKAIAIPQLKQFVKNMSQAVSYTITLEPHHKKWLFSLEMPVNIQGDTISDVYFNTDLQLLNKTNIHQTTQYQLTSMTYFKLLTLTNNELIEALSFADTINPKTRDLGQLWRTKLIDDKKIISAALNYFKDNPFYYTKRPAVMIENPSDQFLFDQKRGFCEHYASSFVLLMRAADIPARVVTGYQGIEKNSLGNYYIVRQSNAHAWAEVWLQDEGWKRIDPTAVIPAERIEADIFDTNLDRLNFSSLNIPDLPSLSLQQKTAVYNFWKQINQSIDHIKYSWNNWILGYDQSKQNSLLTIMGFNANWKNLIILLISGMFVVFILLQLISFYSRFQNMDQVYQYYLKFINKLNAAGMSISLSEGPYAIKQQAIKKFPESANTIQAIIDNYIMLRYSRQMNSSRLIKEFKLRVRQFKIH